MAFVLVGSGGTAISGTSSTTLDLTTTGDLSLANSRFCVLTVSSDNISTSDGATTNHSSVTGGTGTWTKIGEYTNSNAAAAAGVTTSLWLFLPSGANATGTVFTITFSGAVVDKAAQIRRFTWDTAKGVRVEGSPVGFGVDATTGFGSGALSGLPSQEYLFVSGLGKEANTTTALTPSSGWGTWSVARSRNNAAAVANWGEHLISTATGATSSPTLAVSGDTASVVAALEEYSPGVTGTIGGTESGADSASVAGNIPVQGSANATEASTDTAAFTGSAPAQGALAATESGSDSSAFSGSVADPGAAGALAATESGGDTASFAGLVAWAAINGGVASTEAGSDSAFMSGSVPVDGALAASEPGADTAALGGTVQISGAIAAAESGADTAAITGLVPVLGTVASVETGNDTASITGDGATPAIIGAVAASESGSDAVAASGAVFIAGALDGPETGLDGATFGGLVLIHGGLASVETGADSAALSSAVIRAPTATGLRPSAVNFGPRPEQISAARPRSVPAQRPVVKSGYRPRSISIGGR